MVPGTHLKRSKASDSSAARSLAVLPLVKLLERNGQHKTIVSTVAPLGDDASPETLAYLDRADTERAAR